MTRTPSTSRRVAGERVGGLIYGTIVALSVVVAGGRARPMDSAAVAELVLVTSTVFWLAHVYSHGLGESLAHDRRLEARSLLRIARHELSVIEAALPPAVPLALGAAGVLADNTALWLSFVLGLVVLGLAGVVYARIERLGVVGTILAVAANLALGLVLVELKLTLGH